MKTIYYDNVQKLKNKINTIEIQAQAQYLSPIFVSANTIDEIKGCIIDISEKIENEYPYYSQELKNINESLFYEGNNILFTKGNVNLLSMGQLKTIINHIDVEPLDMSIWNTVHPEITRVSKDIYADGHYASAVTKALIEVETRLRNLFLKNKPSSTPPKDANSLICALLNENGIFEFCKDSTRSGKNFREGIQKIFEGAFSAYRNPGSHENLDIEKHSAIEQIILASQMMYVLDSKET